MTLRKIFDLGLVNDDTEIWVRDSDMRVLVHGDWNRELVLEYLDSELECFTWQDDDNFFIDLK
ncbi:hypothetical protein D7X87_22870 [bacterium D16-54]|jgi:hypothetical protein|nr:hypothetical protein D7X87_22870 [bacterium D16-54]RKJ10540.1 hypothetical protein D7X65_23270 [bacterium D16-56]